MITSVRFCLSYDRFKLDFIVFKMDIISIENATLSRTLLWHYMYAPKCYVTVWSYMVLQETGSIRMTKDTNRE